MLRHDAQTLDDLTGLFTYERFMAQLDEAVAMAEKGGSSVAMGLIDLDLFGKLDTEHGRETGNAIIAALGKALVETFKRDGSVYRYGGDAFSVLVTTEKENAFLLFEGFRQKFSETPVTLKGAAISSIDLTVSIGVAAFPDDGVRGQELVRKANEALYRAKVSGRNKVCLAREEKMVTKTSHYALGQLEGLSRLAKREGFGEAVLLREALDDLLRKYNS